MSWFSLAANLLRDAMSSSSDPREPVQTAPLPSDISGLLEVVNQHRSEIDKNFETVIGMLNAQKELHQKAMQIQRRWNYGLAATVVIAAIFAIASYWQG